LLAHQASKYKLISIIKTTGLKDVLTQQIETLSKGYKQRVGLAKALIGDPEYLLLDEPTSGLDPNQKEEILKLIKSIAKEKIVLFSSHILSEVTELADKVVIINEGKIVAEGKADELAEEHIKHASVTVTSDVNERKFKNALKDELIIEHVTDVKARSQKQKAKSGYSTYTVSGADADQIAEIVFDSVVKLKGKIIELRSEKKGLEELFKQLTK